MQIIFISISIVTFVIILLFLLYRIIHKINLIYEYFGEVRDREKKLIQLEFGNVIYELKHTAGLNENEENETNKSQNKRVQQAKNKNKKFTFSNTRGNFFDNKHNCLWGSLFL